VVWGVGVGVREEKNGKTEVGRGKIEEGIHNIEE
jgi:hypothetical protein